MLQVPGCCSNPSYSLFWKILPAELAGEQLLEKTKAHHTFLFPQSTLSKFRLLGDATHRQAPRGLHQVKAICCGDIRVPAGGEA